MAEPCRVEVNGRFLEVTTETTVAAALLLAGVHRRSARGEARTAMCGMGVCFECRAEVDGEMQPRTCLTSCRDGMRVVVE